MKIYLLVLAIFLTGCTSGYDLAKRDINSQYYLAKQIEDPAQRREQLQQIRHDEMILEMREEGRKARESAYLRSLLY